MRLFTGVLICVSWASVVLAQTTTDSTALTPPPVQQIAPAPDTAFIERKPLKISAGIDEGQVVSGQYGSGDPSHIDHNWISRTTAFLTQEATVAKRLSLKVGVGTIIWSPYPAPNTQNDIVNIAPKFAAALSEASGTYKMGALANPLFEFQFGLFPFKYNPEAYDMGEYLLRSGAYPGYLFNGRWNIIGDNLYRALGVRFSNYLFNGALEQHLLATMERDIPPLYDISPTYLIKGNIAKMLYLGGGICYSHLISVDENRTTPKDGYNQYRGDSVLTPDIVNGAPLDTNPADKSYTFRGIKLMGMATFDIKPVLPTKIFGKEDLKIFVEAAVLGVQNYPFYYDDITKRIPVMFGFNFPTFKLLDVLSFEWEYYGSQFSNNMSNSFQIQDPVWYINNNFDPKEFDSTYAAGATPKDNWKWAIYARKSLGKAVSLHLQIANDHMHMITYPYAYPDFSDVTRGVDSPFKMFQKQWYFDFKVQIGI
jgi:hypothetical protein